MDVNQNILFYVHTTCKQEFNTGIQVVAKNISRHFNNYFNMYLVKFDTDLNDLVLINQDENKTFSLFNGLNQYQQITFQEKEELFQKIKNKKSNIFFMAEIPYLHEYEIWKKVMNLVKSRDFKSYTLFHDDTLNFNVNLSLEQKAYYKNTFFLILSMFTYVLPISDYSKSRYLANIKELNIHSNQIVETLLLPGEISNTQRETKNIPFDFYIFSNVSSDPRKNINKLIEAFNILNIDYPNLKLVIAGCDYTSIIKNSSISENKNIYYFKDVSDDKLNELYKNSIFTVYPSLMEGFGLPVYYSLWNGRPCICHNQTSTKEISDAINIEWVSAIDCSNVNDLYNEMSHFLYLLFYKNIKPETIYSLPIKSWEQYILQNVDFIKENEIFICDTVLHNENYNSRGVGTYTLEIINNFKKYNNVTNIFDKRQNYSTIVFTHPPPIRNNMDANEEKTMNLLKDICDNNNNCKKIALIYDIIPHIFKNHYNPESEYYNFFNYIKQNFHIIIAISESTKNDLVNYFGYDENKIIVYYPSVSEKFKKIENLYNNNILLDYKLEKKKYIISPLGDDFRKNIINCIDAYLLLNNFSVKLVFMFSIDTERKKYYYDYINSKNPTASENIIFTGFVSDINYYSLLKNALVTYFPSLYEGFGYCISESIYVGVPVITSSNSSMNELSEKSNGCIFTCNPNDINDMASKISYFLNNLDNININTYLLKYINNNNLFYENIFEKKYSKIDKITFKEAIYSEELKNKIIKLPQKLQPKIKFYNQKIEKNDFKKLMNMFDLNIQIRINLSGAISGIVTDCGYLNKWLVTTNDLMTNCNLTDNKMCITSKTYENVDWISGNNDCGGYSPSELDKIVSQIIENYDNIKKYNPTVNEKLDLYLKNYPHKLKEYFDLDYNDKICFVTPFGDDKSGISDFSYRTIVEIKKWFDYVDIYTDGGVSNKIPDVSFYKIDDIVNNFNNYKKVIWVIGNSHFHEKIVKYGSRFGGCFICHDETFYEFYQWKKWLPNYVDNISAFTMRESGLINKRLCFHDIVNKQNNQIVVHNKTLCENIKNVYNFRNVNFINFPNYNLDISDKLTEKEVNDLLDVNEIDSKKLNILFLGAAHNFKCPNYAIKIFELLNNRNIDTDLYCFYGGTG